MPRTIKRGSTWPPVRMLLTGADGRPEDLTAADSIQYYAKLQGDAGTVVTGTFTKDTDQATAPPTPFVRETWTTGRGWVEHDLTEGVDETEDPGLWQIYAGVTWAPGDIEWFPNTGSETLTIEER
jgi:hypothetical protein